MLTRRQALLLPLFSQLAAARSLAIANVTLIDGNGGSALPNRTVVVTGDRVSNIGHSTQIKVPSGVPIIDGRERYLIPGLWDMHVHLSLVKACALPALLANGVTGVRDMGGMLKEIDEYRVKVLSGVIAGPRIYRAGPQLNGKLLAPYQLVVTTDAEARASVRALQKAGVDFIKVHRMLGREAYFAIADECRRTGIPFAGHVPQSVSPQQASRAHQASIEHVETLFDSSFRMDAAADLFAQFDRDGTWITPTLTAFQSDTTLAELTLAPSNGFADSRARYVAKSLKDLTAEQLRRERPSFTREWITERKRQFEDFLKLAGLMGKNQVRILAGTDLASSVVYPGFSLHDELGLLVDGGLTPMQALQSATKSPAAFLKLPEYGTVEVGKMADLVLLDADPLEDIRNTQKIRAVFCGGNHYGRESLDALLAESARQALTS